MKFLPKFLAFVLVLHSNMCEEAISIATQSKQLEEFQDLTVLTGLISDGDFMDCLFLQEITKTPHDCLKMRNFNQQQLHYV